MGGHAAGEVASRLVIAELEMMVEKLLSEDEMPETILTKEYAKANLEILESFLAQP